MEAVFLKGRLNSSFINWKSLSFDFSNVSNSGFSMYRKVASRSTSRLVARPRIFRLFMKGKFDAYVLWPLAFDLWPLTFDLWIVDRSTARDFTVVTPQAFLGVMYHEYWICYRLNSKFLDFAIMASDMPYNMHHT